MTVATARMPRIIPGCGNGLLHLTLAVSEYEHMNNLTGGLVRPGGIALTSLTLPVEEIAFRSLRNDEFDIAETSFAKFITMLAAGDSAFVALPVFPARMFRHSCIYVRRDSGIASPKDLEGNTVGIPEWAQTAGVYTRGMLSDSYGVALDRVRWVQAGVNQPGRVEKVSFHLPPTIRYEARPNSSLSDLLASGEIAAAISARPPNSFLRGDPAIARMFPNFRVDEEAYFNATGIFPIMHVMALRRVIFDTNPWVARNLLTAFEQAKEAAIARLRDIMTSRIPMPWTAAFAAELERKMGGDLWPYGVDANRHTLTAFCRFAHAQYLTPSLLTPDDLFPKEVINSTRV